MNEENRLIIEQLNKFGRVPETYELLKTIEDLEQENQKYKEVIDNALSILRNELYKSRCRCDACNDYFIENLIKLLEQKEVE